MEYRLFECGTDANRWPDILAPSPAADAGQAGVDEVVAYHRPGSVMNVFLYPGDDNVENEPADDVVTEPVDDDEPAARAKQAAHLQDHALLIRVMME